MFVSSACMFSNYHSEAPLKLVKIVFEYRVVVIAVDFPQLCHWNNLISLLSYNLGFSTFTSLLSSAAVEINVI